MKRTDLRLELLVGRRVFAMDGNAIGRLHEFRATREGEAWVVTEFDIGPDAALERLAVRHFGWIPRKRPVGYRARWDQIDLSDPIRPRLTCPVEELQTLRHR